jgi:transposase-like protein
MGKSGAHKLAIDKLSQDSDEHIEVRQIKYLNNIVEQDHRAVKRITRPILGLKISLRCRQRAGRY